MTDCKNTLDYFKQDLSFSNFFNILESYEEETFLEYHIHHKIHQISYQTFAQDVRNTASKLFDLTQKISKSSFIALKVKNSPKWPVIFWSILMAGYKPLLIDANLTENVVNLLIGQAGATAIISDDHLKYDVEHIHTHQLLHHHSNLNFEPIWANEIAFCSSGTMGKQHIHVYDEVAIGHQILNAEYIINTSNHLMYDKSDGPLKNLAFLPFNHVFGFIAVLMWFSFFGKTIVFPNSLSVNEVLSTCQMHEVTHIFSIPAFWNRVAKNITHLSETSGYFKRQYIHKVLLKGYKIQQNKQENGRIQIAKTLAKRLQNKIFGNKIRFLISGGDYISTETLKVINSIGYPLHNGFGMTEVGITSCDMSEYIDDRITGSIGHPFPSVEYRLKYNEAFKSDELLIRGKSTHTAEIIDGKKIKHNQDDWIYTGDMAVMNDSGVFINGRMKDMLFSDSGEKISPAELEKHFTKIPFALSTALVGLKNGQLYDQLTLVVQTSKTLNYSEQNQISAAVYDINTSLLMYQRVFKIYITNDDISQYVLIKPQRKKLVEFIKHNPNSFDIILPKNDALFMDIDGDSYKEIREKVRKAFIRVLEDEQLVLDDDSHFMYDLGGDSLTYYILINEIGPILHIESNDIELMQCSSVNTFVRLYAKRHPRK